MVEQAISLAVCEGRGGALLICGVIRRRATQRILSFITRAVVSSRVAYDSYELRMPMVGGSNLKV